MRYYPSLFAYLNNAPLEEHHPYLQACDRPIIASSEALVQQFLIPHTSNLYEVAFPYLKPQDLGQPPQQLAHRWDITINRQVYFLRVSDEVIDSHVVEEEQLEQWQQYLGEQLDNTVADLMQVLNGLVNHLFSNRSGQYLEMRLLQLPEKLILFNVAEVKQPLIISLERRYKLQDKLEILSTKLRHQLRRQAELMPVGRIQEMDPYCLRDYIRRPGRTAAEKAGSKQELMGVQRYQDYNTAENKFLVYFNEKILHLECLLYLRNNTQHEAQVNQFRQLIERFTQQPEVQLIQAKQYQFTTPNYVLQQNPLYSSFYQAFLDYLRHKSEKEQIWAFRNQLLVDTVYLCLLAAVMQFQGAVAHPLDCLTCRSSPDYGRYLKTSESEIKVFLQHQVYIFKMVKSAQNPLCDILLTAEIHQLNSLTLNEPEVQELMLWIFWYRPTATALEQAEIYLQNQLVSHQQGRLLYLQTSPQEQELALDKPWLQQLPNWNIADSSAVVTFLNQMIQNWARNHHG